MISIGIKLKNQLSAKSFKLKFISQNKQLFGSEIYLNNISHFNNQTKVKIHDSWYFELEEEFQKKYWVELSAKIKNSYKNKDFEIQDKLYIRAIHCYVKKINRRTYAFEKD